MHKKAKKNIWCAISIWILLLSLKPINTAADTKAYHPDCEKRLPKIESENELTELLTSTNTVLETVRTNNTGEHKPPQNQTWRTETLF